MKIVAFGDSTTAIRAETIRLVYSQRLERMCRAAGQEVEIINAGIPGNTTDDARERFDRDVLAHKPTMAIIQFGINDSVINVWKNETVPPVSREKFSGHLCHFINRLREYSAFPILMTPNPLFWTPELLGYYGKPPYDRNDPNGLNLMLSPYADEVRLICSQYGIPLVDVYMIFNKLDIRKLLLDGMHPNDEGHAIVAEELFKLIVA